MKEISIKECRKREQKWLKVLDNWDYWIQKRPEKVPIFCRLLSSHHLCVVYVR